MEKAAGRPVTARLAKACIAELGLAQPDKPRLVRRNPARQRQLIHDNYHRRTFNDNGPFGCFGVVTVDWRPKAALAALAHMYGGK